jgi:hypothetical protein
MRHTALIAVLLACACGPGNTRYWKLTSSTIAFNAYCSDNTTFRGNYEALQFQPDSYFIYTLSQDRRKALRVTCVTKDPSTCTPDKSGIVFDVDVTGKELAYSKDVRAPTGVGMCTLATAETWFLTDQGSTMSLSISDTLSLVDDPATCTRLDMDLKAVSPNGQGYQGCTISYQLAGSDG